MLHGDTVLLDEHIRCIRAASDRLEEALVGSLPCLEASGLQVATVRYGELVQLNSGTRLEEHRNVRLRHNFLHVHHGVLETRLVLLLLVQRGPLVIGVISSR